jgi:hypothetical protein
MRKVSAMIKNHLRLWAILLACACSAISTWAADVLPVLKTKTETYQNVTLLSKTETHLFIQHSRGLANIRIAEVDIEAKRALGLAPKEDPKPPARVTANSQPRDATEPKEADLANGHQALASSFSEMAAQMLGGLKDAMPASVAARFGLFLAATFGLLLFLYLFYSYCVRLICLKAGYAPGLLAWLPILRDFALVRAAGMSVAWFLVLMSPGLVQWLVHDRFPGWKFVVLAACLLALTAHIYWCIRICLARGKGGFAMLFLIFPLTYPFAFLYLAFSGGSNQPSEDRPRRIRLGPMPA